ncbi:MAG: hypothetical protein KTR35_22730 [Gammaproteobacteria bacterium]|nr:hypothetical protein [Gammaproteobacteria bacterium]
MNDTNKQLEQLLKDPGVSPPEDFCLKLMFRVGQIEQDSSPQVALKLIVGKDSIQNESSDLLSQYGDSIKQIALRDPIFLKAVNFARWLAVAVGGVFGIQQSLTFLVGAWTASAAL